MKRLLWISGAVLLAGCGNQTPAPVVDGYGAAVQRATNAERQQVQNLPTTSTVATSSVEEEIIDFAAEENKKFRQESAPVANVQTAPNHSYTVVAGDTVYSIARKFEVTPTQLTTLNNLRAPYVLMVGQNLNLPANANTVGQNTYKLTAGAAEAMPQPADIVPETTQPRYSIHKVARDENLFRIGQKYGVSFIDIMALNDIKKPENLTAGMQLRIPVAGQSVSTFEQEEAITISPSERTAMVAKYRHVNGLIWPVEGAVIKRYGAEGHGISNTGINIASTAGTPVLAADDGTVIYADSGLASYGNLVLLRHRRGYVTAYGHNQQIYVKPGEQVAKGQVIATVGATGNVEKPQLHFEVRRNARAVDPLTLLPKS